MKFMRRYLEEERMLKEKVLVFHLFISDDFDTNNAYKIHAECMKRYKDVFTDVRFIISVPDVTDRARVQKGIDWVMNIGFNVPITMKIVKNTVLCETDTLFDEVLNKLDTFDGLVCFAQGKGVSNFSEEPMAHGRSLESIARWICALYYFNFNFMEDVDGKLFALRGIGEMFYGPCLGYNLDFPNKAHYKYCGTFYWLNPVKFSEWMKEGKIVLPKVVDRYYAEDLPGNTCGRERWGDGISSHGDVCFAGRDFDLYNMNKEKWAQWARIMKGEGFIEFSDDILNTIGRERL